MVFEIQILNIFNSDLVLSKQTSSPNEWIGKISKSPLLIRQFTILKKHKFSMHSNNLKYIFSKTYTKVYILLTLELYCQNCDWQ